MVQGHPTTGMEVIVTRGSIAGIHRLKVRKFPAHWLSPNIFSHHRLGSLDQARSLCLLSILRPPKSELWQEIPPASVFCVSAFTFYQAMCSCCNFVVFFCQACQVEPCWRPVHSISRTRLSLQRNGHNSDISAVRDGRFSSAPVFHIVYCAQCSW